LCSFHDVVSIDERDGLPSFFAVAKKKLAQAEQLRSSLFSFFSGKWMAVKQYIAAHHFV